MERREERQKKKENETKIRQREIKMKIQLTTTLVLVMGTNGLDTVLISIIRPRRYGRPISLGSIFGFCRLHRILFGGFVCFEEMEYPLVSMLFLSHISCLFNPSTTTPGKKFFPSTRYRQDIFFSRGEQDGREERGLLRYTHYWSGFL